MTITYEDMFMESGVSYSHKKQPGMIACDYMWKHHPSGKSEKRTIWVDSIKQFHNLCIAWTKKQPLNWLYLPLNF